MTPGRLQVCQRCGYEWEYTGAKSPGLYQYTSCPECGTTVKIQ